MWPQIEGKTYPTSEFNAYPGAMQNQKTRNKGHRNRPKQDYSFYNDNSYFATNYNLPVGRTKARGCVRPNKNFPNSSFQQEHQQKNYEKETRWYIHPNSQKQKGLQETATSSDMYFCPKCEKGFTCKYTSGNKITGKIPLILHCHHTICQECIYKNMQNNKVTCPICQIESILDIKKPISGPRELQSLLLPNYYIIGVILFNRSGGHVTNLEHFKFLPTSSRKQSIVLQPLERCSFNRCVHKATMFCPGCEAIYCQDCCTLVHKNITKLMSHEPVPYKKPKFILVLEQCAHHPEMKTEFLCKDCDLKVCCYCIINNHSNHDKETLNQLSQSEMDELNERKKVAEKVLKQVLSCQKKTMNIDQFNSGSVKKEIHQYFSNFIAKISSIEKQLCHEAELFQVNFGNLESIQASLASSVDMLKELTTCGKDLSKDKKMNLRGALEELRKIGDVPRFLLSDNGLTDPIQFIVDPSIATFLDHAFELKKTETSHYKLVTDDQLNDDYILDSDADNEEYGSLLSNDNNVTTNVSEPGKKYMNANDKSLNSGMGKIIVQHINSIENFYVQYKNDQSKIHQLNNDIENYVSIGGANIVKDPQINRLYLALYIAESKQDSQEQRWCRARLISIEIEDKISYEMYFIDYGRSQFVDADRIKDLPIFLASRKPFAIECTLHNPMNINWTKNSHYSFGKILNGKEVYMIVKSIENGIREVDLMVASSDGSITSVIDILVHATQYAASSNDDTISLDSTSSTQKDLYPQSKVFPNSKKFKKHQDEKVIIANIVDPHNIIVHLETNRPSFNAMCEEMKRAYKRTRGHECVPLEGTYVMVEHQDSIRLDYHRALIKSADLNNNEVSVHLVDWGLSVVIPSKQVRPLPEKLTKLECQAILIKMAHIAPYNNQSIWNQSANNLLEVYYRSRGVLKMVVNEVTPQLEVGLFDVSGNVDLCLNAMMVENHLANSTGTMSSQLEWPHLKFNEPSISDDDGFIASLLKKVGNTQESEDEYEDENNIQRKQLDVIKVESPDAIWIKSLSSRERDSQMYKELQIHYSQKQERKERWNVNELCVAELENEFARGKITGEVEGKYMVHLYDKGEDICISKEKLFIYKKYFMAYPAVAIKSHLANITPAGDTGKWSISSIEILQEILFKRKRIYGTIERDEKKTLPLHLWYGEVVQGGPLDPDRIKFVSINNILVKLGFAYRTGKSISSPVKWAKNGDDLLKYIDKCDDITDDKVPNLPQETEDENINEEIQESSCIDDSVEHELEGIEDLKIEDKPEEISHIKSIEEYIDDWLPSFRLTRNDFEAIVTCVETGGHLFLRDQNIAKVYDKMEANIKLYFDSNPPQQQCDNWQPGDLCSIKYDDGNWYRGKILRIKNSKKITVIMVDFGSDHDLSPDVLYKEVLYTDYNCFATKVKLDKVYSRENSWLSSDYDNFHTLVTDICRIVVKGPLEVELPSVDVYNSDGIYVNDKLVEMCPNLSRQPFLSRPLSATDESSVIIESIESDVIVEEEILDNIYKERGDSEKDTLERYNQQTIPDEMREGTNVAVEIGGILSWNKVALKLSGENISPEMYDLIIDIQDAVESLPPLTDIKVGNLCLAQFSEDGVWYRGRISSIEYLSSGYVNVFYVDYGNSEKVSTADLRKIPVQFLKEPQQTWEAFLNINLVSETDILLVYQYLKTLTTKKIYIQLVKDSPLTVDLYDEDGKLCYHSLIGSGLLDIPKK